MMSQREASKEWGALFILQSRLAEESPLPVTSSGRCNEVEKSTQDESEGHAIEAELYALSGLPVLCRFLIRSASVSCVQTWW